MRPFVPLWLGRVPYAEAFALQRTLHAARAEGRIPDVLLLLEHPPTVTHSFTGKGLENLVATPELLAERGVVVEQTDRGGNITFHGPGQLVGYPIVALEEGERDLHRYLRSVEEVLLRLARDHGVETDRVAKRTGTWIVDETGWGLRKLAAIGVKCSRWVTLHGFAMNVTTDLGFFDLIVPCGLADAGVTSLQLETGEAPPLEEVAADAAARFAEVFERAPSLPDEALRMLLAPRDAVPLTAAPKRN